MNSEPIMNRLALGLLLVVVMSAGCTHYYEYVPVSQVATLRPEATALIAPPADGQHERTPYPGSGLKTAYAVKEAFQKHLRHVEISPDVQSFDVQLSRARADNFDYLVVPTLLHWENRATEWSGKRDRIVIELRVVDTATWQTLTIGTVKGASKWLTFGGDLPEDLLAAPTQAYVDLLFQPATPPREMIFEFPPEEPPPGADE